MLLYLLYIYIHTDLKELEIDPNKNVKGAVILIKCAVVALFLTIAKNNCQ